MGAPAINYSAPRVAARNITAPASNLNVNEVLGLQSSPYSGLQQVGGQNLYYGDGGLYEAYSPSSVRYYRNTPYGITQYYSSPQYGLGGGLGGPLAGPSASIYGGYSGGWQKSGGDVEGTIRRDGQAFKPSTNIPAGFVKTDDGKYIPSMAYVYTRQTPQITAQPNTTFSTVPGYQAAVGNLLGNLAMSGTGGAGRFLGGNVPALNLGTPSGKTAG